MTSPSDIPPESLGTLLIVDDDPSFNEALTRAMQRRGYSVISAHDEPAALRAAEEYAPEFAIVDLRLGQGSGLSLVERLAQDDPEMRIVVLTGYASIATAVEAIKLGARHYLAKPANTDDIEAAFQKAEGNAEIALAERPTSIKTLEWERIHQTLIETDFNISEAARRLGMHRRTLARKLEKRPVK
jgi:two-component system response regulator RegA